MKKNNSLTLYVILLILVLGVIYTACKEIKPETEHVVNPISIKLNK